MKKRAYALLLVPFAALILLGFDCELPTPPGGGGDASSQTDGGVSDGGVFDGGPSDGGISDGGGFDGGPSDGGISDGGVFDGGPSDGGISDGGGTFDGGGFDGGGTSDGGLDGGRTTTGSAQQLGGYRYVLVESLDATGVATPVDTVIIRKPDGATYQAFAVDAKASHGGYVAELPVSVGSGDELYLMGPAGDPAATCAVLVSASPLPGTFSLLGSVDRDHTAVVVR